MKKDEFIGYLTALQDLAETHFTEDEIPELIGQILDKAKKLELTNYTYPWYPYSYPKWPNDIWITYDIGTKVPDFNTTVCDQTSWSIKTNETGDFTVVK